MNHKSFNHIWGLLLLLLAVGCSQERPTLPTEETSGEGKSATTETFVSSKQAEEIARGFYDAIDDGLRSASGTPTLIGDNNSLSSDGAKSQRPLLYFFRLPEKGFMIVSAEESAYPVLAYSTESDLDLKNLPTQTREMIRGYAGEISKAREKALAPSEEVSGLRSATLRARIPSYRVVVAPLLGDIKWNQSPYYNDLCPVYCPVGCVATATCQVMRYWEWPEEGQGAHEYRVNISGQRYHLSTRFDHPYKWSEMPRRTLRQPNREIARLGIDVAVALNMSFSPMGSGAYTYMVPEVLKQYFRYDQGAHFLYRDYPNYFRLYEWEEMIRKELREGRPLVYCGSSAGGGHAFVCDGYDTTHFFHINWGWGGVSDGWFRLNALDPSDLGTGAGAGSYNRFLGAVFGLQPPAEVLEERRRLEEPEVTYPAARALRPGYIYLSSARFGDVEVETDASDYSDLTEVELRARIGETMPYSFGIGRRYSNVRAQLSMWIDLNRNGRFEETELFLTTDARQSKVEGRITFSRTLRPGKYRIRLVLSNRPDAAPDRDLTYGEVEDYSLTLTR